MRLPATLRALQYRDFQLFFSGQFISLIGTWMQNVAQAWLVYRLTGSSVLLGAIGFSSQIPVFLLSPAGGIVADRWQRRRVVIATQTTAMLLAFALAFLTLSGRIQIWHIFVLSALLGAVNAFDIPARQSFIVEMVGKTDLMNAIALNSSMFNASRVLGPAIAGILVAWIGEGWCFFANAVSYIAVIIGLFLMRVPPRKIEAPAASPTAHIIEGFRWVVGNPAIHALLMLLGVVSLAGMPYTVLMPIFADRILHGGAKTLGVLMGATGIGALGGALILASRTELKGLNRWVAVSGMSFGALLVAFGYSRMYWLSMLLLVCVGFAVMIENGSSNTLIQSMVPDHLRGRVMALYSMMFMGMAPIGSLISGAIANRFGAPMTVAAGGALCLACACVFFAFLPRIRVDARRLIVAQQMAAGDPAQEATCGGIEVGEVDQ
jgi:MFS family permease